MNTKEKRSFNKELMALAAPIALQNLLNALVGASDVLMLGRLTQGLSAGARIMISQLLGQNLLEKAKQYGKRFWSISRWSGLVNIELICIVGSLVYAFYVLKPMAKSYLIQMLIFSAAYMFAYAYNTIITCGVFPAGGDSRYDAISVFFATVCHK